MNTTADNRFKFTANLFSSLLFATIAHSQTDISGTVPLPESPPGVVMSKRYEIVSNGGTLSTMPPLAVVWLEGDFGSSTSTERVELAQKDFRFEPPLLPIQAGTTVAFPNFDSEYHNVFSYSRAKRFDLGRYLPDEIPVPTQTFDTSGQVVLRCDIHEHMKAVILVLDSPYFVKSDPEGNFSLKGIPDGKYTLKAWINSKKTLQRQIEINGNEKLTINLE